MTEKVFPIEEAFDLANNSLVLAKDELGLKQFLKKIEIPDKAKRSLIGTHRKAAVEFIVGTAKSSSEPLYLLAKAQEIATTKPQD